MFYKYKNPLKLYYAKRISYNSQVRRKETNLFRHPISKNLPSAEVRNYSLHPLAT
jgi:hypothetical protein